MIVTLKKDCKAILSLQKRAFLDEAIKYNDPLMPAMTQTLEQIQEEFDSGVVFFKYEQNNIIIGSVRAVINQKVCNIGKLIVDPNFQNQGIGKSLMKELETYFDNKCDIFKLFTGEKSKHALGLYKSLGYKITYHKNIGDYSLVYMEK